MSDEAVSQPEDTVSRVEFNNLQEQLKAARTERDREKFEKAEIVAKANAAARERDDAKQQLASLLEARDKMIGDIVSDHEKALADMTSQRDAVAAAQSATEAQLADAESRAVDAARRVDEAAAEIARLRQQIESAPATDPLVLLWALVSDYAKKAHDWIRAKIPADSPILPWFDKIVATSLSVGCTAVKLARDVIAWATPRAIELFNKGKAELEARLARK